MTAACENSGAQVVSICGFGVTIGKAAWKEIVGCCLSSIYIQEEVASEANAAGGGWEKKKPLWTGQ
jgi:hypothetical protein